MTAPSPILQDLNALGVPRLNDAKTAFIFPDGTLYPLAKPTFLGVVTFAQMLAQTGMAAGTQVIVSDLGYATFVYNGARWRPPGGRVLLAQSGAAVINTGSTTENTLATILVPGGLLGTNGVISVMDKWSYTSSTNAKTMRFKLGGQVLRMSNITTASINNTAIWSIQNQNSASVQLGANAAAAGNGVSSSTPFSSGTVNTAVDQLLTITSQLALDSETNTLEAYTIEAIIP